MCRGQIWPLFWANTILFSMFWPYFGKYCVKCAVNVSSKEWFTLHNMFGNGSCCSTVQFFVIHIPSYHTLHSNSSLLYYTISKLSCWKNFLFYMWIIAQSSDHSSSLIWRCFICFVCVVIGLAKLNKLCQSNSKCYFQVQLKPFLRNFDFRWSEKLLALKPKD